MIKKILVPVDGSEHANRALDFALDLAQKYSAEILVMTVVHYPSLVEVPLNMVAYYETVKASYEKVLSEALEKAKTAAPDLNVTSKLMEGYPADRIIETAQEGKFDIIVMGRRGQGHLRHTLLGSVSDRVADLAPCGLFIIR
ncbi:universal stress protein [Candidatus Bathyarchaeota archaeon]|nr:universal stress protein [Candidatus Bathyarchaeota archaeon]